jgi:hypothetical protein
VDDDSRSRLMSPQGRVGSVGWSRYRVELAADARVLDVGSGPFPNMLADVLCERHLERPGRSAVRNRPLVVGDAHALPFRSGAFDFVIASHLAEHLADPVVFCAELNRVAGSGYVETPSAVFEALLPEEGHLWTVRRYRDGLRFEPKPEMKRKAWQLVVRRFYYLDRSPQRWLRVLGAGILPVRAVLNRAGLTVTRIHFSPSRPLIGVVGEVRRSLSWREHRRGG